MIEIKIYKVTPLETNCVYLYDKDTGDNAVVDPGAKSEELIKQIIKDGGNLKYVLLTHGHYDHIGYAQQLANDFGAEIVTGKKNEMFLSNKKYNLSSFYDLQLLPTTANILLSDNDFIRLGNTKIKYIENPGHTSGCGSFVFDNTIICGDVLFCESYGRTDLPTGNDEQMVQSMRKLKNLDGNYKVIPGHGELTTLDHERQYNPLMRTI